MVHRLRNGETIRAQYKQSRGVVDFTLSHGAADLLDDFPEEGDRAEERIFERLRKAHFNIKPTESSGFLCRKIEQFLFHPRGSRDTISVEVERIAEQGHAPRPTVKQKQVNSERWTVSDRTVNSSTSPRQNGQTKPPSLSTSSFGRSQPATYMPQVSSSPPAFHNPSQGGFNMLRPKEQSTTIAHPVAPEGTPSLFFGSSSALTSGLSKDSGDQIMSHFRSVSHHSSPEPKSLFSSKPSLGPPSSSTTFSLFDPPLGPSPFKAPQSPIRSLFSSSTVAVADSGLFGNILPPVKRNSLFDLSTGAGSGLFKKTSPPNLPSFTFNTPIVPDAAAGLFGKTSPPANRSSLFGHSTVAGSGLFGKPSSSERPLLAATTKAVPEVIVIDSSPDSSPTPSPQQSLSKERAAGK